MGKPQNSIMTTDLENCFCCGRPADDTHHVYGAGNRPVSTQWGLVIPVCRYCHEQIHHNKDMMDELHEAGQHAFEEAFPGINFRLVFGRNYI